MKKFILLASSFLFLTSLCTEISTSSSLCNTIAISITEQSGNNLVSTCINYSFDTSNFPTECPPQIWNIIKTNLEKKKSIQFSPYPHPATLHLNRNEEEEKILQYIGFHLNDIFALKKNIDKKTKEKTDDPKIRYYDLAFYHFDIQFMEPFKKTDIFKSLSKYKDHSKMYKGHSKILFIWKTFLQFIKTHKEDLKQYTAASCTDEILHTPYTIFCTSCMDTELKNAITTNQAKTLSLLLWDSDKMREEVCTEYLAKR